ncbi:uncharacterized protein LOC143845376 [Tasmannia lanceolata]|uniref:uncharacterized protein LOC143845376 n=1 Tax=Tasmannia lanceolata TaxID=3420 RepID=UPI00406351B3
MDFSGRWTGIQPQHQTNPTPNPNPIPNPNPLPLPLPSDPYAQFYNAPQHPPPPAAPPYPHYQYYPPNPNLNPNPVPNLENPPTQIDSTALGYDAGLRPPGIDPYGSNSYVSHVGFEGQNVLYPQHQQQQMTQYPSAAVAPYYQDPGQQSWAVKEAIRQFGSDPVGYPSAVRPLNGIEPMAAVNPNQMYWNTHMIHPFANGAIKRGPKKTKVVQSAWCEICKIDCNSKDVLDQHKLGKKHKKNLEKLEESKKAAIASVAAVAPAAAVKPKKRENPSTKRKGAELGGDLETKRQKIMEGGAAANSVRVCAICNVVCNSQIVFNYHLAGQKHAAQVKKHAGGVGPEAVGLLHLTAV